MHNHSLNQEFKSVEYSVLGFAVSRAGFKKKRRLWSSNLRVPVPDFKETWIIVMHFTFSFSFFFRKLCQNVNCLETRLI